MFRYYLTLASGLFECLGFTGVYYGWASLVFVLKKEEYFLDPCFQFHNDSTTGPRNDTSKYICVWGSANGGPRRSVFRESTREAEIHSQTAKQQHSKSWRSGRGPTERFERQLETYSNYAGGKKIGGEEVSQKHCDR